MPGVHSRSGSRGEGFCHSLARSRPRYHDLMPTGPGKPRLPLFPLADVVHFPRTELKLHVVEPSDRKSVV